MANRELPSQLLLDFPLNPVFSYGNLIVGEGNRQACQALRDLNLLPGELLTLVGEEGTGKTHLLQATVRQWRLQAGEEGVAVYLDMDLLSAHLTETGGSGEQVLSDLMNRYAACRLVALDDLQELENHAALQEGVLFLFRHLRERQGRLVCASRRSPLQLVLRPDLGSRLSLGLVVPVLPPGDEERAEILRKMAIDRQVRVGEELLRFLAARLPRRVADYAQAIDHLDQEGLRQQRPWTIPLAKEVLGL
ncbi:MAG: hypothetical protein HQL56_10595 [Magnetococcales bacterium]|nr:hypothetical protein [Magnetococcales bacterium]